MNSPQPSSRKKSAVGDALKGIFRSKQRTTTDNEPRRITVDGSGDRNLQSSTTLMNNWKSTKTLVTNNHNFNAALDGSMTSRASRTNAEGGWDLKSCIDTIESLLIDNSTGLSDEQKAAIENLRTASESTASQSKRKSMNILPTFIGSGLMKRFTPGSSHSKSSLPSSSSRPKNIFITEEMRKTWIEVATDQEDKDRQQCVHDVLEVYGGGRFDAAWGSRSEVPSSLQKIRYGKTERRSAAAPPDISTMLSSFKSDSMATLCMAKSIVAVAGAYNYCPPEWNRLTPDAKAELTGLLSVENLEKWEFDVFKLAELTRNTLTPEVSGCDDDDDDEGEEEESSLKAIGEQFCPLLFVGWAILCAPLAQFAMEGSLEGYHNTLSSSSRDLADIENTDAFYCNFCEQINVNPEAICNFLREIERRYVVDNPYHNNVHASDVTQTLHALFAFIGKDLLFKISSPLEIFSLIMAATFHDVGHPGTNNLFHKNAMTPFAMQYNDVSILENMHAFVGHSLLMGEERRDEWDVFKGWKQNQIIEARVIMIRAIMGTDMSNHFLKMDELLEKIESVRFTANVVLQSELGEAAENGSVESSSRRTRDEKDQQQMLDLLGSLSSSGKLNKVEEPQILEILAKVRDKSKSIGDNNKTYAELKTECSELTSNILTFLLHSADISNPSKPKKLAVKWANKALAEFFAQGDKEKELSLPISPLCDKETTKTADSQIGFLQFVVRPMYIMLADIVPGVKEEVLPIVDKNLKYWQELKVRSSMVMSQK